MDPPVPFPNTVVKRPSADDTALVTEWENRSPPGFIPESTKSGVNRFRLKEPASCPYAPVYFAALFFLHMLIGTSLGAPILWIGRRKYSFTLLRAYHIMVRDEQNSITLGSSVGIEQGL